MITEILILVAVLVLLSTAFLKPARMPPGSFGLPFLGELPPHGVPLTQHLFNLMKERGNIFTTKWGAYPIVVLTDFNLIRKAYNHPDLQGRSKFITIKVFKFFKNLGVTNNDGPKWVENRQFLLRQLRDLGMGKTALEDSIQDEAAMLVDHLEKTCVGKPAVMDVFINGAVVNVIWQMLASKRYDINSQETLEYNQNIAGDIATIQGPMLLLDIFPILTEILPTFVMNKVMKMDVVINHQNKLFGMFKKVIKEHLEALDANNPRDVVDQYLLTHPDRDATGYLTPQDEEDLLANMDDMFIASSETISTTIRWMILYLAVNPEIQVKIHKVLDEVVPKERLPSLSDRNKLQYVDAMLLDVLRLSSLAPLTLPHKATADVEFEGYIIPKDTMVLACSEICHHDPAVWEKPNTLHPEHFLDQEGNLDGKKDSFLPFSVGRRQCLGESLARMELFLFSAAILQRFTIEPPEGATIVPEKNPEQTFFNFPKKIEVVLHRRI